MCFVLYHHHTQAHEPPAAHLPVSWCCWACFRFLLWPQAGPPIINTHTHTHTHISHQATDIMHQPPVTATSNTYTHTCIHTHSYSTKTMPKAFGDRAGDMLLGAAFAASLGAVAVLLRKRKGDVSTIMSVYVAMIGTHTQSHTYIHTP